MTFGKKRLGILFPKTTVLKLKLSSIRLKYKIYFEFKRKTFQKKDISKNGFNLNNTTNC